MKFKILFAICLPLAVTFLSATGVWPKNSTGKLMIRFENLQTKKGVLRVALYDNKVNFMVEEKAMLHNYKLTATENQMLVITGLPFGDYAFAIFQDENENQILDKNIFGVPTEPYGFSENPKAKWRLPSFQESSFSLSQPSMTVQVRLERWRF